mmetsp:Transcript_77292/g.187121  ORF Transcript_77292/g.187121 Transcript_77292/m.187121 type:complete len:277 (+) Transcript_77292:91-921(+)
MPTSHCWSRRKSEQWPCATAPGARENSPTSKVLHAGRRGRAPPGLCALMLRCLEGFLSSPFWAIGKWQKPQANTGPCLPTRSRRKPSLAADSSRCSSVKVGNRSLNMLGGSSNSSPRSMRNSMSRESTGDAGLGTNAPVASRCQPQAAMLWLGVDACTNFTETPDWRNASRKAEWQPPPITVASEPQTGCNSHAARVCTCVKLCCHLSCALAAAKASDSRPSSFHNGSVSFRSTQRKVISEMLKLYHCARVAAIGVAIHLLSSPTPRRSSRCIMLR